MKQPNTFRISLSLLVIYLSVSAMLWLLTSIAMRAWGVAVVGPYGTCPATDSCEIQEPWSMAFIQPFRAHSGASAGRTVDLSSYLR